MKAIIGIVLCLGTLTSNAPQWDKKVRKKDKDNLALEMAEKYCINTKTIGKYNKMKMSVFTHSNDYGQVIVNFSTFIHENYHMYNWSIENQFGRTKRSYFIDDDLTLTVPLFEVFNSVKLNRLVKRSTRDSIFRYEDYVGNKDNMRNLDSKVNGIYGLLEEFAAYYQGSRSYMQLRPLMETNYGYQDHLAWHDYLTTPTSSLYALYEFQLFISWYLQYAQRYDPDLFKKLMSNERVRLLYSVIVSRFEKVVQNYFSMRQDVIDNFGMRFKVKGEYLYIDRDGDEFYESGTGIPDEEIFFLKKELKKSSHNVLKKFRMSDEEMVAMLN